MYGLDVGIGVQEDSEVTDFMQIGVWLRRHAFRAYLTGLVLLGLLAITFAYRHHHCSTAGVRILCLLPVDPARYSTTLKRKSLP